LGGFIKDVESFVGALVHGLDHLINDEDFVLELPDPLIRPEQLERSVERSVDTLIVRSPKLDTPEPDITRFSSPLDTLMRPSESERGELPERLEDLEESEPVELEIEPTKPMENLPLELEIDDPELDDPFRW
jgi:hypothetical protein